jgi:diguanylate cyclase (GGDEF)-like protein/PAS domain S-box-containing protein
MTSNRSIGEWDSLLTRIARARGLPVSRPVGYALSVAFVGAALAARLAMHPAATSSSFVTFYCAVVLAAMLFGAGPGLGAVVLSAVCVESFFLPPVDASFWSARGRFVPLAAFTLSGLLVCFLAYKMRQLIEAPRSSELRFRLLASSTFEGVVMTEEGRYIDGNERFFAMLGYAPKDLIGTAVAETIPAVDRERVMDNIRSGRESRIIEHSMISADGRLIHVEAHGQTIWSEGRMVRITAVRDITERKRTEQALRREAEKNLALLRNASDGIHILDEAGNVLEVSDSFCAMLGYTREQMMGMNVSQWDAQLGSAGLTQALEEQFKLGARAQFETRHRRKDGTTFRVEISGFPLQLDGKPVLFNAARDITERKQLEETLAAREQQWRTLVENSPNTIARYDRECRRIYVNPAFAGMSEGGAAALVGKSPAEFPGGMESTIYEAKIREVFATGENADFELNWKDRDGRDICSQIRLAAERDLSGAVTTVLGVGNDITELIAQREKIHQMAFYDHLTNLPNRRLLQERLQEALALSARSGRHGALLFIDLDDFKTLNDTLGHAVGDALLQQVATRLKSCVRGNDSVARLGGDEFVVILEGLSEHVVEAAQQIEAISSKIFAAFKPTFWLATHQYHCTTSIGATLLKGHEQAKDELIKQADIAMYQAKKAGRNSMRFFDPKMQETISTQAALEGDLRQALERRQLHLYFQIQVDSANRPLGAEALIRWIHPMRGVISPAQFIPLAEDTDLIVPIGQWVLETACAQLKAWEQDALTCDLALSVNVSAKQFHRGDFVDSVRSALQRHDVNPALLTLELTESLLLERVEDTVSKMNTLRTLGVHFSLDDFGTGYSSLQYLKRLPLHQLKIDQSFVRDIALDSSDLAIVQTIIAMAHSLNLAVIAEGVEAEEQRRMLISKGCKEFQGYLFGKPATIEEFDASLRSRLPSAVSA